MIRLGSGIELELDGTVFRFDPRRIVQGDVCMVSHAHADHLPTSFRGSSVICSDITRDFMRLRRKKEVEVCTDERVRMLEAGHIAGSRMFLVRAGGKRVLYTGDFCTREKEHTRAAKPQKCDVLIMEATYGRPQYVFPDHAEIMGVVRDWLEDVLQRGCSAVLFAYPLGKSQELSAYLKDFPLVLHPSIAENNRLLRAHGFDLPDTELDHAARPGPFVYITSGPGVDAARVSALRRKGAKTAAFSGWALDKGFTAGWHLDEAFPVSDHCGFDELLEFVKRCDPELVFTTHGFAKEFAMHIRRALGIQAQPLVARQKTLDHFC